MRANEILRSSEAKQSICNQILGCSHKEVERVMLSIVQRKSLTDEQREQLELQEFAPQKLDPSIEYAYIGLNKHKSIYYQTLTREECLALLAESKSSLAEKETKPAEINYSVYSLEEVQKILSDGE